ncbi:MAG: hypothetical protein ABR521_06170 [Gaiellaceae bacterium]
MRGVFRGGYQIVERGIPHAWDPTLEYRGIDRLPGPRSATVSPYGENPDLAPGENALWAAWWDAFYEDLLCDDRALCERLVRGAAHVGLSFEVLEYYLILERVTRDPPIPMEDDPAGLMRGYAEVDQTPEALESHPSFLGYDVSLPIPDYESVFRLLGPPEIHDLFRKALNSVGLLNTVEEALDVARVVGEGQGRPWRYTPVAILGDHAGR